MSYLISLSLGDAATLAAAAAFFVGGIVNATAFTPIRDEFVRYGYPWWWCWVTALLEFATAALLVVRPTFVIGAALGIFIMIAAIFAVVRAREFRHALPPAVFLLLLVTAITVQVS